MAYLTDTFASAPAGFGVITTVKLWLNALRERRALRRMSYSQLDDIGVHPSQADREANKIFWNVASR